jgi:uncharacterized protein (TIRG00374 family)
VKRVVLAAQLAVTIALLIVVFRRFEWQDFQLVISRVSPAFYLATLAVTTAGHLAYAFRWKKVLSSLDVHLSFPLVMRQHLIALFLSNVLPSAVAGDAAKVYYLGRSAGYVDIGASVFVDRFIGLYWLALFGALFALGADTSNPALRITRDLLVALTVLMTGLIIAARFAPHLDVRPADAVADASARTRWRERATRLLRRIRTAMQDAGALTLAAVITVAYQLLMAIVYLQFFQINGAGTPNLVALLTALFGMSVAINIPISINGVGLREQLHVLLFSTMGLDREAAVGLSLLLFSQLLLLSLAGGLAWMRGRRPQP